MTKQEFLQQLRESLESDLSGANVNAQVSYYRQYIEDEIKAGKTEEEVLEMLGDPWVIAKNILESPGSTVDQKTQSSYTEENTSNPYGNGAQYNGEFKKIPTWKIVLAILGVILVIMVIFAVIGGVISLVAPIILPVVVILIVIQVVGNIWRR